MTKGDLTYNIHYPSSEPKESFENGENEKFLFFRDGERLPVVILFGWTGSQDKHLAKYSAIYEDQGYITFRCRLSLRVYSYRPDILPNLARKFLDIFYGKSFDQHPIIFHIFSNGGTLFYKHVTVELQKQGKALPIKGVIFDSALYRGEFRSIYSASAAIVGGPVCYNAPASFFVTLTVMTCSALWPLIKASAELKKPEYVSIILDDEPSKWPQLLIYSKTDDVTPWKDVEKFARRREEKGIKVVKLCFENSPHVQHLKTNRELYIRTVLDFMKNCLSNDNQT